MTLDVSSVDISKMAVNFTSKSGNRHKMNNFEDISFIFLAIWIFSECNYFIHSRKTMHHYRIWPKCKEDVHFMAIFVFWLKNGSHLGNTNGTDV